MDNQQFTDDARRLVKDYANGMGKRVRVTDDMVYVVWSCKTLQNNKAMLSTSRPDGMYYEVTYNGNKHEMYLDAYSHVENVEYDVGVIE